MAILDQFLAQLQQAGSTPWAKAMQEQMLTGNSSPLDALSSGAAPMGLPMTLSPSAPPVAAPAAPPVRTRLPPPETELTAPQSGGRQQPVTSSSAAPMMPAADDGFSWGKLGSILSGAGGSNTVLGAIGGAIQGGEAYDRRNQRENLTLRALTGKGLDPQTAQLVASDPHLARSVIPALFKPNAPTDDMIEYAHDMAQRRARGDTQIPTLGEWMADQKKAGRATTTINMGGEKAFATELGKQNAKAFTERRQAAMDAVRSLDSIDTAFKLLDDGMLTGFGANWESNIGKALHRIGFAYKQDPIENAEAYLATRAGEIGTIIKLFGAGTGLSDKDREFAEKAAAGQITLNEGSMRRILEINEKAARNVVKRFNAEAETINPAEVGSPFPLTVEAPPEPKFSRSEIRESMNNARAAIQRGANRNVVIQELRRNGIDPEGL